MKTAFVAAALLLILAVAPAAADRLAGSEVFLCSPAQAVRCWMDGECESGPPWTWNIPDFIRFDLGAGMIRTTRSSGEARESPIGTVERSEGLIAVQGYEHGRAVSIVISEETGLASMAMAMEGSTVTAFGACTPLDKEE